jgi:hypothetical protein
MTTQLWTILGGVLAALGAILGAYVRGVSSGRQAEQRTALEARVRGAEGRADADAEAAVAADPVNELRVRGWVRSMATDYGQPDGQRRDR